MIATPDVITRPIDLQNPITGAPTSVIMPSAIQRPVHHHQQTISVDVNSPVPISSDVNANNLRLINSAHAQSIDAAMAAAYGHERKFSPVNLTSQQSSGPTYDQRTSMQRHPSAAEAIIMDANAVPCASSQQPSPRLPPAQHLLPQHHPHQQPRRPPPTPMMIQQQPTAAHMIQQAPGGMVHSQHDPRQQQQGGQLHPPPPTSSDACASIVHSLMCHRHGGDESFSQRAIESLVKKLKDKRDELDALIQAITTAGNVHTKCVTIQRTLDGRLQVAGRKGFPHVVYAKIWRWHDLVKNELKQVKYCQYAFDLKLDLVCVNPYHYERVVSPGIGNIDLSALRIAEGGIKNEYGGCPDDMPSGSQQQQSHQHPLMPSQTQLSPIAHAMCETSSSLASGPKPSKNIEHRPGQAKQEPKMINQRSPLEHNRVSNNNNWPSQVSPGGAHGSFQRSESVLQQMSMGPNLYSPAVLAQNWNMNMMSMPYVQTHGMMIGNENGVLPLSSQPPPDYWCSIAYYELDTQIGETFKVPKSFSRVTIDGFVNPTSSSRFCLGALSNVHRTEEIDKTRIHIGKGVVLSLVNEGDVYLTVESQYSVFVQSFFLDREAGRAPGDTVHKIYPEGSIKVFDLQQCHIQMHQEASNARAAATAQAAAVSGLGGAGAGSNVGGVSMTSHQAGMSVDELRRFCIIRFSFVKGWGPDYPRRNVITMTPCWIEVHLHRALQLLDEVLNGMPGSNGRC